MIFLWELKHYILLAIALSCAIWSIWCGRRGWRVITLDEDGSAAGKGAALLAACGILFILTVVFLGIFQDMRLNDLCAVHGTCGR